MRHTRAKKLLALLLAVILIAGALPMTASAATVTERENNDTTSTAQSITANDTVSGNISTEGDVDFYKFTLSNSGRVNINHTAHSKYYRLFMYNTSGTELWDSDGHEWNSTVGFQNGEFDIDLEAGTYYLKVTGLYVSSTSMGKYNFTLSFTSANTNHSEPNNSIEQASKVNFDSHVRGLIACNDDRDFFSFTLPNSGRVHIDHTAHSKYYRLFIYNTSGTELWNSDGHEWNSTVGFQNGEFDVDLEAGTYYLKVTGLYVSSTSTGKYNFTLSFTSANANNKEPDNSLAQANRISYGQTARGQIALNDEYDFFKFQAKSSTWKLNLTTYIPRCTVAVYDTQGNEIDSDRYDWNETSGYKAHTITYNKGYSSGNTYYIKVQKYSGTGNYSFYIGDDPDPDKVAVTGVSLNKTSLEMKKGETASLSATVLPFDATDKAVTWSSSNTSVATVTSGGMVKAVSEGTAVVTVKTSDGGYTARCTVKVTPSDTPYVTSFSVNGVSGRIDGDSKRITVTLPEEAEYYTFRATTTPSDAKAVLWLNGMTAFELGVTYSLTKEPPFYFTMEVGDAATTEYQVEVKVGSSGNDSKFTDVPSNTWYYESVQWAVESNITSGTSTTTFSPQKSCTRSEAVTFLWRAAGQPKPSSSYNPFHDVKSSAYYYDAVLWAVENGVTAGTGETTFSPNATCTRAQIVTFLYRAESSPEITGNNSFDDVKAGAYYENAVKWAVENGITSGTGNGKFSPGMKCDRSQIITFLYRYSK